MLKQNYVLDRRGGFLPRGTNPCYHDFSNARTPQNRDSYESVEVGCFELLFEPAAIRLNGFHTYLELRRYFEGCFAIAE
ncbi:MAG TPA: hypothetical protein VNY07_09455 [Chthoniobacterales bacterium]|jgi:hypothetical protein|nr:hypothetical protein [Chthoniobacterales bacterium]